MTIHPNRVLKTMEYLTLVLLDVDMEYDIAINVHRCPIPFDMSADHRYMTKFPRRPATDENDIPSKIVSWMFSSNKQKRNRVWGDYPSVVRRPHTDRQRKWFEIAL